MRSNSQSKLESPITATLRLRSSAPQPYQQRSLSTVHRHYSLNSYKWLCQQASYGVTVTNASTSPSNFDRDARPSAHCHTLAVVKQPRLQGAQTLKQAYLRATPAGAICVQKFNDSRGPAIRITYRISLRSSSVWEPRHPLLKVVFYVGRFLF